MYTNYNSQNANKEIVKDPNIYVTEGNKTMGNKIFSVIWKVLLVIILIVVFFLALIQFGVISLNSDVVPEAVLINQNEIGIKKGGNYQFVHTVVPENATNKQVVWESSNPNVVRVNEVTGYAEALRNGTATITVKTLINEKVSECLVTVSNGNVLLSSIQVNQKNINLAAGYSTMLSYKTTPSNATELGLQFSSSDPSVAKVNSKGKITGVKPGSAIITVSSSNGKVKDTSYVTIYKQGTSTVVSGETVKTETYPTSIKLSDSNVTLTKGGTTVLKATVAPVATSQVINWSSSNTNIATVDENGLITARSAGTATIVAKTINNLSATCNVTIKDTSSSGGNKVPSNKLKSIDITTNYSVLPVNVERQLFVSFNPSNAANKNVTWSSSDSSVVRVDSNGNIRTLSPGTAIITAKAADGGYTDTATIEVVDSDKVIEERAVSFAQSSYTVAVGGTIPLSPIITPGNASFKAVDFSSSNPSVATVDANGLVKGISAGEATIKVKTRRNGLEATAKVKVTYIETTGVSLNKTSITIPLNDTFTLIASVTPSNSSEKTVVYKSENPRIATVDSNGIIKGITKGTTTITVTPKNGGNSSTCIVTVN